MDGRPLSAYLYRIVEIWSRESVCGGREGWNKRRAGARRFWNKPATNKENDSLDRLLQTRLWAMAIHLYQPLLRTTYALPSTSPTGWVAELTRGIPFLCG